MAVIFPNNWVDGDTLEVQDIVENDELMRKFVNQDILDTDLQDNTLGVDSVQVGEYRPVTKDHQFMSGDVVSSHVGIERIDRSYFTSHIKPENQDSTDFKVWTPVYEAGQQIVLEQSADVLINFGGTLVTKQNQYNNNKHRYLMIVQMRYNSGNGWVLIDSSKSKAFEESYDYSGTKPTSGTPSSIPDNIAGFTAEKKVETMFRRWIGFAVRLQLPAGTHQLGLFLNPTIEMGYFSSRNFTVEVFYI